MVEEHTLRDDHRDLDSLRDEVFSALDQRDVNRLHKLLDRFWARLAVHIRAEHRQLFPVLIRASSSDPRLENLLDDLRRDHDHFMKELGAMVAETRKPPPDTSSVGVRFRKMTERLELHNRTEESQVYPKQADLLSARDRADLDQQIRRELDNMPPRFDS